ncbi:hypothetical protein [Embleya sp. NPDC050493]|uniref:hypothetical protein n=1 Tax=Embleya sp. NPDC050493 TaxID=3363989 RepID=UPI003793C5C7
MTEAPHPLSPGTHTLDVDGTIHRYHVSATGPVRLVHSHALAFASAVADFVPGHRERPQDVQ